jgi:predicted amidohydrolase
MPKFRNSAPTIVNLKGVHVKIAVVQFAPSANVALNRSEITKLVAEAAAEGARLVVLPEEAMLLAEDLDSSLAEIVEVEWPIFEEFVINLAQEHSVALIAGGYEPSGRDLPFNTLIAVDQDGTVATRYHKLHLYDAFFYKESGYVTPGKELPPVVSLAGIRVGLINCYDLRFPEHARYLIDQGADILSISAAWVSGPCKEDHWETLARARAIENTIWIVAAGSISPECIGHSMIIDPLGITRVNLGDEGSAAAVVDVTRERTDLVRERLPSLLNRRLSTSTVVSEKKNAF